MGWFSDCCSAVFSGACSIVSSIASSIGGVVGALAGGIGSLIIGLPPIFEAIKIIGIIINVVCIIAELLGVKNKEETPVEIGMKAEKSTEKPEDFDNYQGYIDHLRNNIKIDKEEMEKLSPEQKLAYGIVGSAIYIKGIEAKTNMILPAEFWVEMAKHDMKAEQITKYIDSFKAAGVGNMKDMSDCLSGKLDRPENAKISDIILHGLKELNPGLSDNELSQKFIDLCNKSKGKE